MALSRDENFEDGAYAADARGVMRQLPEFIRSAATDIFYRNTPPAVFLIGATRFLGPYILHEILDSPTEARVIAHVLAEDAAVGLNRLESTMKAYGLWSLAWINTSRLEVVIGDISKPQLGLCQNFWHRLLDEVDIVVHNGAQANWMLPYSRLQAPNVLSTMACILSTTSQELGTAVPETGDLEGSRKGLGTGYGQSKWASEFIVGARPNIVNTVNAIPVTRVSRIIIAAALHLPVATGQSLGVAQVTSHPRLTLNERIGALETYGYRVPMVSYQEWCTRIKKYVYDDSKAETRALLPLFHFVMGDLPTNTIAPELENANAAAALRLCADFGHVLAYLVAVGFLPAPAEKGGSKLPRLGGTIFEALPAGRRSARP
ncbi:MAG: large subunit of alpha-aminoadipate reductase [Alectoria sarmentosa]|nr:MAG: large subunit of alpha-aminoadipate reductase [Alectoria sarmentosa]